MYQPWDPQSHSHRKPGHIRIGFYTINRIHNDTETLTQIDQTCINSRSLLHIEMEPIS